MDSELLSFLDKVEISSASESPSGALPLLKLNSENLEMGGVRSAHTLAIEWRLAGFCPLKESDSTCPSLVKLPCNWQSCVSYSIQITYI